MSEKVLTIKNLNKTFTIREKGHRTIRDSILRFYQQKGDIRKIKALKDINFEVEKGEFFGIIGRNGSGKSTLLRLIIGSYKADAGSIIKTKGKMVRLALGLGFDGNLSARENIYINGSVLGLSFKKIGSIFDEVIAFAELENFIDTPVKHYSSGMLAKLKFSIAIHAEADILLMDEIFGGVGDISFQRKSFKVFEENILKNRTIIFVSHSLQTMSKYCDRILLLDRGDQIKIGTPEEIIPIYEDMFKEILEEKRKEKEAKRAVKKAEREQKRKEKKKERQLIKEANKKIKKENRKIQKKNRIEKIKELEEKLASAKLENEKLKISQSNKNE